MTTDTYDETYNFNINTSILLVEDLKNSLCIFPFFVCVWFNSEDSDKLLDNVFPLRFMKNLLQYYDYFLTPQ